MKKIIGLLSGLIGIFLIAAGIVLKVKRNMEISIIGGADGPTSVFVAGQVGSEFFVGLIVVGVVLFAVAGFIIYYNTKI